MQSVNRFGLVCNQPLATKMSVTLLQRCIIKTENGAYALCTNYSARRFNRLNEIIKNTFINKKWDQPNKTDLISRIVILTLLLSVRLVELKCVIIDVDVGDRLLLSVSQAKHIHTFI